MNSQSNGNSRGRRRAEIYDLRDDYSYSQRSDVSRPRRPQSRQDVPTQRSRYQDDPRRSQYRDSDDLRPRYQQDELARKPHYHSGELRSRLQQSESTRSTQYRQGEQSRRSQYYEPARRQYDRSSREYRSYSYDRERNETGRRQQRPTENTLRREALERRRKEKLQKSIVIMVVYFFLLGLIGFVVIKHPPKLFTDPIPEQTTNNNNNADSTVEDIQVPSWVQVEYIDTAEQGNPSRSGVLLEGVNDIVVHYVANPRTSAEQNRNYFNDRGSDVCSHFLVGLDGEVIQCLPLNEKSASSNERNRDTISIEVCHPDMTGKFTDASYQSLVKLTKWLLEQYNLDPDHVIRHYDITGKACPLYFVEHPDEWEKFKEDLKN